MPDFTSYDGTRIAYRVLDQRAPAGAPPLVCLAGGPGRDAAYLGDLGGLDRLGPLVVPDSRGTGASDPAADPVGYSFPRLAEDVESLRALLGLERFVLLAHSAGATTALAYAAAHGPRLAGLVLVTPGSRLLDRATGDVQAIFESRAAEPWFADARAALEELESVTELRRAKELLFRIAPATYGRWDEPQRAHAAAEREQIHPVPRAGFWQGVDESVRLTIVNALRRLACPVLVVGGERDAATGVEAGALVAGLFPGATHTVLPGAGHYPWVDEPGVFRGTVGAFLERLEPRGGPGTAGDRKSVV